MDNTTRNILGGGEIVLAILVALNQYLGWNGNLQYLWAVLVLIAGIWTLLAK